MRDVSNDELKQIAFEILSDVAKFCDNEGIQYYLACGTLLGAVRHKGFIPWDDDLDIAIPREQYERFVSTYKSERFCISNHSMDSDYPYYFAKVFEPKTILIDDLPKPYNMGVYIDVFPMDGLPDDDAERKKHLKRILWKRRFLTWKRCSLNDNVGLIHKIVRVVMKLVLLSVRTSTLINSLEKELTKYPYEEATDVGALADTSLWGSMIKPKTVFDNPVKLPFETGEFWAPGDYKKALTIEYGDYMKLPPVEKRVQKHGFEAYWRD